MQSLYQISQETMQSLTGELGAVAFTPVVYQISQETMQSLTPNNLMDKAIDLFIDEVSN